MMERLHLFPHEVSSSIQFNLMVRYTKGIKIISTLLVGSMALPRTRHACHFDG